MTADTVAGCLKIQREIEAASKLRVTGLISNTHLMDETDGVVIAEGVDFAREVSREVGQEVRFVTVEHKLVDQVDPAKLGAPVLVFERLMLPPWRKKTKLGSENFRLTPEWRREIEEGR